MFQSLFYSSILLDYNPAKCIEMNKRYKYLLKDTVHYFESHRSLTLAVLKSASLQEPRKLSYAEVCQRPPKDPPPATTATAPSGAASGQPLRELRVNKAEELGSGTGPGDKQERGQDKEGGWECKESRPPRERDSIGYYRSNGPRGSGGLKFRDQRRPPPARRGSPQGGYRHTGKEQNIPPVSPK